MTILLYRYTGDPTRVYKTDYIEASSVLSLDGELRDESSVIDPVILITTETNLSYYNYAYVDYFARYYFARFEVVRTGVWRAILHSDVLSNAGYYFASDTPIGDIKALIARTENPAHWNPLLMDSEYPINADESIEYKRITWAPLTPPFTRMSNPMSDHVFTLTVSGARGTSGYLPGTGGDGKPIINTSHFTKTYAMTVEGVRNLSSLLNDRSDVWNRISQIFSGAGDNLMTALISLKIFPFDVKQSVNLTAADVAVRICDYDTTQTDNVTGVQLRPWDMVVKYLGGFTINAQVPGRPSFIDYNATYISIYLPFIGVKDIRTEDVIDKTIDIYYATDPATGNSRCLIVERVVGESTTTWPEYTKPLYEYSCNVAIDIPIAQTNGLEAAIGRIVGVLGAGAKIGASAASGNVLGAISGATDLVLNNWDNKVRSTTQDAIGDVMGYNYVLDPFVIIRRTTSKQPLDTSMLEYRKTHGLPSMREDVISDVRGFTIISSMRYDDIPLTQTEINELDGILRTGAIFPDPDDPTPPTPPTPPKPPTPPEPPTPGVDLLGKYGIDISEAQAGLTWADYSQASPAIDFAIIRAGIVYADGSSAKDLQLDNHIADLDSYIPIGFYFVPNADTSLFTYRNQGIYFANLVKNAYVTPKGKKPPMSCWLDIETGYGIFEMDATTAYNTITAICDGFHSVLPDVQLGIYATYIFGRKMPSSIWSSLLFWEAIWGRSESYADSVVETYTSIVQYGPDGNNPPTVYPRYVIDGRDVDKDRVLRAWWS